MYAPSITHEKAKRFCRWLALFLAAVVGATASAAGEGAGAEDRERWYRVEMGGEPAGWAMERELRRGDEVVTESKTRLELRRGPATTTIEMESRFVESRDGRPLRAWTKQALGAAPIETSYEFGVDGVVVRYGGGDREEKVRPPEGEWVTPGRVQPLIRERLASGAEEFSVRTLDPLLGLKPVTTRWVLEANGEEAAPPPRGATTRWRQTQSYAPQVETVVDLDAEGLTVYSTTSMMGMEVTMTLTEREAVLGVPTAAPELLVRSFVRPDRGIERPRAARRAVYGLDLPGGTLPELPSAGAQTVVQDAGSARVTVDLGSSRRAEDVSLEVYLRSTTLIPHDDAGIRGLLAEVEASGGRAAAGAADLALALRAFVAGYLVDKDLDTVLATAAEAAATRSGDCTEHSVLLAALLRAAEIPSRVVSGLIYVESFVGEDDIFGYHMWTQALLDGRWVDLDATLPRPFDAAHIALAATPLDDHGSALEALAAVVPLMGRVQVEVLEVEY